MKRFLLTIVMALSYCCLTKAQENTEIDWDAPRKPIHIVQTVLEMDDYTYVCDTVQNYSEIRLYNIENMAWDEKATLLNGDPIPNEYRVAPNGMYTVEPIYSTHLQKKGIVDNAFSKEQVEALDGEDFFIILRVSSTTGRVTDVYFKFKTWEKYTEVPLEVFREMELKMKNELQFEITALGKSLTYSALSWSQCPEGRAEESTTDTEDDTTSDTGSDSGLQTDLGGVSTDRGTTAGTIGTGGVIVTPTIGGQIRP